MNIYRKAIIASMTAALMATGMLGAQGVVDSSEFTSSIESVVVEEAISSEEGILLMREEEKLARDVYLTLYEKWNLRTFSNIARAEQKHMDAVAYLLSTKGIEDPVKEAKIGEFTNEEIGALYTTLVEKGSVSITEALKVGALIEDLDIFDLERLLLETTDELTIRVYESLLRGSEQHLRAFTSQLSRYNQSYVPVYLSEQRVNEILGRN